MEHHHGFDYTPDQLTATCACGLIRANPYYNPLITQMPYYAYYCSCGEYNTGNSGIEYTTFAELHKTCANRPATGTHMHINKPTTWIVRQYRKAVYEFWRTYYRLMFRLTNTGK